MDSHHFDATGSALPTASLSNLCGRAGMLRAIRGFFETRNYLEVETPLLSRDVNVDAWLEPFAVNSSGSGTLYLQTSPELHMKRLLAAGARRIYQLTRAFRHGERGVRHNPEFTILEWYAVGETYVQQMQFVEDLVRAVAATAVAGNEMELAETPFRRVCYDDAFAEIVGTSVQSLSAVELRNVAEEQEIAIPRSLRDDDRDGWLNLLLSAVVEPALARYGAVFLYDYPDTQAALAQIRDDRPPLAERFELYLNGIEICNGYQELTDADEFDRRMASQSELRRKDGREELPVHSRLSEAMRAPGLPECAGVALGVDRLAMWRLGAGRLDEVVAFPTDRA